MFGRSLFQKSEPTENAIEKLKTALSEADAVIIGAGAGLSTSAGFTYAGERFQKYFGDFEKKYGFHDMYSGGFTRFESLEEQWAYWSRNIYVNRYMNPPKQVYENLFQLVKNKDYFVLTTNVDHCFQRAGFDKKQMFYTQGDYGLWQCSEPCHQQTYDNEETVKVMLKAQGFAFAEDGTLIVPENPKMVVPTELVPHCPVCGKPMTMNLRCDDTFVEDEGWHQASERYSLFVQRHQNLKVLFLELGTGWNTPSIVKYNFWRMTNQWPDATYACINLGDAYAPKEIEKKSICIDDDIDAVLKQL